MNSFRALLGRHDHRAALFDRAQNILWKPNQIKILEALC